MAVAGPRRAILGPSFLPQSRLIFSAFTSAPSYQRKLLINKTVASLISAGIWNNLDALWFIAAADSQAAGINWIAPGTYTFSPQNNPTFTANQGYKGDGTGAYIATGLTLSTAVKFQRDSGCVGLYVRQACTLGTFRRYISSENGTISITEIDSTNTASAIEYGVNSNSGGLHNAAAVSNSSNSLLIADRPDASNHRLYKNGMSVATKSAASVARPAYELFLLARNNTGTPEFYSDGQISFACCGASLSAAQNATLNTIVNTYLTAVGAI